MTVVAPDPGLAQLLDRLHPSELALRDWVAPKLDASMIEEIAAADYGYNIPQYRREVEDIRHATWLPEELSSYPEEVLALTRWSTVDAALSPLEARRQHLMRLFCSMVLVRASTINSYPVDSLAPLLESAVELGPEALEAAGRFLAWCRLHEPGDWRDEPTARPFLTLALVLVFALPPARPDVLPGLIGTFAEELSAAADDENLAWSPRPVHHVLKLVAQGSSRRIFVSLANRCLLDDSAHSTGHGVQLTVLGQAINGDLAADAAELRSLLAQALSGSDLDG